MTFERALSVPPPPPAPPDLLDESTLLGHLQDIMQVSPFFSETDLQFILLGLYL